MWLSCKQRTPMSAGFLPVALSALFISLSSAQQLYEGGSYNVLSYTTHVEFALPSQTSQGTDITLTYPSNANRAVPLVLAFNGFQCKSAWYTDIVKQISSWGYVVMQYDLSSPTAAERDEVTYLQPLLDWLESQAGSNSQAPIAGRVDLSKKAVLGHSRGGKLAALHYANRHDILTAVLVDPVDCAVGGPEHPSAVAALGGREISCGERPPPLIRSPKTAAVIGAGFVNRAAPCNPITSNYASFANQLAPGTWQIVFNKAGHMQFPNSGDVAYKAMEELCGHGDIETEDVVAGASTIAVAWLEAVFRLEESQDRLQAFGDWLDQQQAADALSFQVLLSTNNGEGHLVPTGQGQAS